MSKLDHDNGGVIPSASDIEAVMAIVTDATTASELLLPASPIELSLDRLRRWFLAHAARVAMVMLGVAGLALYSKSQPLANTTLTLGIIAQLLALAMMITTIVGGIIFANGLRKNPYGMVLERVRALAYRERAHIDGFAKCSPYALRYVLLCYRHERNGYEKRGGMIAGAIDKIGIFPALAALVLLVWNLLNIPGAVGWAAFFGPLLFAFYWMALASAALTQKMDRVIALLEYGVQSSKI